MTNRAAFLCVALLCSLYLAACHSTDNSFDPIGRWNSKEGYEVTLRTNGTYQFCDRGVCSEGRQERPGGRFGVTLVDFFNRANSARIAQELKKLYAGHTRNFQKDSDLDFTANSGIAGAGSDDTNKFCDYKPCVLFGNLETGPNLAFTKTAP